MLYSYRVARTGTHLLRTGEVEADLTQLAPEYGFAEVAEARCAEGAVDRARRVRPRVDERHRANWPRLQTCLDEAAAAFAPPADAPNTAEVEARPIESRQDLLRSS